MRITTQRSVRGTNALLAAVLGVSMLVLAWGISVGNVYVAIFVGVVAALCFVLVGTVSSELFRTGGVLLSMDRVKDIRLILQLVLRDDFQLLFFRELAVFRRRDAEVLLK